MKAKTHIHLLDGSRLRTAYTLGDLQPALDRANGATLNLTVLKDHGEERKALVPLIAIVWLEEVS